MCQPARLGNPLEPLALRAGAPPMPQVAGVHISFDACWRNGRLWLITFAENRTDHLVTLDGNLSVRRVTLSSHDGQESAFTLRDHGQRLGRVGPLREWVAARPGQRLRIGRTLLSDSAVRPIPDRGSVSVSVSIDLDEGKLLSGGTHTVGHQALEKLFRECVRQLPDFG